MSQWSIENEKAKRSESSTTKRPAHIEYMCRSSSFWSMGTEIGQQQPGANERLDVPKITTRQSLLPLTLLTVVFIILGFAGGIVSPGVDIERFNSRV